LHTALLGMVETQLKCWSCIASQALSSGTVTSCISSLALHGPSYVGEPARPHGIRADSKSLKSLRKVERGRHACRRGGSGGGSGCSPKYTYTACQQPKYTYTACQQLNCAPQSIAPRECGRHRALETDSDARPPSTTASRQSSSPHVQCDCRRPTTVRGPHMHGLVCQQSQQRACVDFCGVHTSVARTIYSLRSSQLSDDGPCPASCQPRSVCERVPTISAFFSFFFSERA
jgi:hypothetical protein